MRQKGVGNLKELILSILPEDKMKIDEPLRNHSSFKIGGTADFLVIPSTKDGLVKLVAALGEEKINYIVIGNGSNIIFADEGFRGVVIKTTGINECSLEGDVITAGNGILLSSLANFACNNSLGGLEFVAGIPGTLGGAVLMNAGAYGGEMKDVVIETEYLDVGGSVKTIKEHGFGYRKSIFSSGNEIILESKLKLFARDRREIAEHMVELANKRREKQPLDMPSAGSTFKRPEGYFAGKLIEDAGLRGFSIGGAQVSEKHCGFIVNRGDATAKDVLELISYCQKCVLEQFGVELETEVKYMG